MYRDEHMGFWWADLRKRRLGRPRRRWKDNSKMDFQEWDVDMDWINLAQDRDRWRALENAVMKIQVP